MVEQQRLRSRARRQGREFVGGRVRVGVVALPLRRTRAEALGGVHLVHQEINASGDTPVDMVVARSSQENVVVNVDLPPEVSQA